MFMFSPAERIKDPRDFQRAYQFGHRLHSACLTLVVCQNSLTHARLGISVSKKSVPSAVARNYVKRLARETFRVRHAKLGRYDLLIVVHRGIGTVCKRAQYRQFIKLWDTYLARLGKL